MTTSTAPTQTADDIESHDTDQPSTAPSRPARTIPARSKALAALLALVITIMGLGVGAQPASAATGVSFCFREPTSSVGGVGLPYANKPVYLMRWESGLGRWVNERAGWTNSSGCGTFYNTPTNYHLTVRAYVRYGNSTAGYATYDGWSPYYAPAGRAGYNIGTGYVKLTCQWGTSGYCAGRR